MERDTHLRQLSADTRTQTGASMTLLDLATLRRLHEAATNAAAAFEAVRDDPNTLMEPWRDAFNEDAAAQKAFNEALHANFPALLHAADQWAQVQGMKAEIEDSISMPGCLRRDPYAASDVLRKLLALIEVSQGGAK